MEGNTFKFKNKVVRENYSHKQMFMNPFKGMDCRNYFGLKIKLVRNNRVKKTRESLDLEPGLRECEWHQHGAAY